MGQLMDDIINTAKNFSDNTKGKGTLDYSIESLNAIDALLEELRTPKWDEDTFFTIYTSVGCYVFETARRNYGGTYWWLEEEQQPILVAGEPDFCVEICAWEKVQGRLNNGMEDNIPFYIDGYKECIERGKKQKGYRARVV